MTNDVRPVYAVVTGMVNGLYPINRGEVRDERDPIVALAPHMFSSDPRSVMLSNIPGFLESLYDSPVEQATAAPGEKRGAVRRA